MRHFAVVAVFSTLLVSGCSSGPTELELKEAAYSRCKNLYNQYQDLVDSVLNEGYVDQNDPRLSALNDKWNINSCKDYTWPNLDNTGG